MAVDVVIKAEILNAPRRAILAALDRGGYRGVSDTRADKQFELTVDDTDDELGRLAEELLANSGIESPTVTLLDHRAGSE